MVCVNVWHLKKNFDKIFKAPFPDISPPAMVGGSPAPPADPPSSLLFRCLFFLSFWFTTSSAVHVFHCKHSTCFAFDAKLCDSCLCKRTVATTSLNTSSDTLPIMWQKWWGLIRITLILTFTSIFEHEAMKQTSCTEKHLPWVIDQSTMAGFDLIIEICWINLLQCTLPFIFVQKRGLKENCTCIKLERVKTNMINT